MQTTSRGYPYPGDTVDPPDGGAQLQALAQAVNNDVDALYSKPMARVVAPTGAGAGTGWGFVVGSWTLDYDTDRLWSAAQGVFFVNKPGIWRSRLRITFPITSSGVRGVGFGWSTPSIDFHRTVQVNGSGFAMLEVNSEGVQYAGGYVHPMVICTGGAVSLAAEGEFTIEWVRPLPGASS